MSSNFRYPEPHILVAAIIRDETDRLVRLPENRNVGHGPCRQQAIAEVLAGLLSVERDGEGR